MSPASFYDTSESHGHLLSPQETLWHQQVGLAQAPIESLLSQSCGAPTIKLGWGAWHGVQSSHCCGRTSAISFSHLWVTHPGSMGFDYIASVLLLPFCCGFFFVSLDIEWLFFLVDSVFVIDGLMVAQPSVMILVRSWEDESSGSFYSTILYLSSPFQTFGCISCTFFSQSKFSELYLIYHCQSFISLILKTCLQQATGNKKDWGKLHVRTSMSDQLDLMN